MSNLTCLESNSPKARRFASLALAIIQSSSLALLPLLAAGPRPAFSQSLNREGQAVQQG
jgi:hypothetical protein